MTSHLTEKQICRCIAGDADPAENAHLAECPGCAAGVERTRLAFANFRRVAEDFNPSGVPSISEEGPERPRQFPALFPIWSAVFALLVFVIAYGFPFRGRTQPSPVHYDDAALLNQVSADVQRTAPYSLSPLSIPVTGAVRR